jgi:DNA-binding NarL/FixJ family response regulator
MEDALESLREELDKKAERDIEEKNPYNLSFRELTVLHLVSGGRSDKEIGLILGIRPLTVSKHVANVLKKMRASSRTEAGVRALREGLID